MLPRIKRAGMRRVNVSVTLDIDLVQSLEELANREQTSISNIIRRQMRRYLSGHVRRASSNKRAALAKN